LTTLTIRAARARRKAARIERVIGVVSVSLIFPE